MIVYNELSTIVTDLGISAKTLYSVSNSLSRHYRHVKMKKADGFFRELSVPDPLLNHIQKRICQVFLAPVEISPYAAAYRPGGSIIVNARPHVNKEVVLKLDIYHFFDNVLYSDIKERVFPAEKYSENIRVLLTMLCYYNEGLPQGAPTSPAISNIILKDFDERVGCWCEERNISYTRYCDDMTFSGGFDTEEVKDFVAAQLRAEGFFLNERKTCVACRGSKQKVTGLVVNEKVNVPSDYRRKIRQEIFFCRKFGVENHLQHIGCDDGAAAYLAGLMGKVSYVLSVSPENNEFLQYRNYLKKLISEIK